MENMVIQTGWKGREDSISGTTVLPKPKLLCSLEFSSLDFLPLILNQLKSIELIKSGLLNKQRFFFGNIAGCESISEAILDPNLKAIFYLRTRTLAAEGVLNSRGDVDTNIQGNRYALDIVRILLQMRKVLLFLRVKRYMKLLKPSFMIDCSTFKAMDPKMLNSLW